MFKCAFTSDVVGHEGEVDDMPKFRPERQETATRPWLRSHCVQVVAPFVLKGMMVRKIGRKIPIVDDVCTLE
jgi:hypothetical protein